MQSVAESGGVALYLMGCHGEIITLVHRTAKTRMASVLFRLAPVQHAFECWPVGMFVFAFICATHLSNDTSAATISFVELSLIVVFGFFYISSRLTLEVLHNDSHQDGCGTLISYLQISGAAMDFPFSSVIAKIFMNAFETSTIFLYPYFFLLVQI